MKAPKTSSTQPVRRAATRSKYPSQRRAVAHGGAGVSVNFGKTRRRAWRRPRHVGRYAADAANTLFSPAYDIVDIGVSYDLDRWLRVPARAYLNVDNLFDAVYASTFNSLSSVGTGAPRFVRVGVQLGF